MFDKSPSVSMPVVVPMNRNALNGDLVVPHEARGLVLFAHGSGSSRSSVRNQRVARTLERRRLATLLIDTWHRGPHRKNKIKGAFGLW